MTAPMVDYKIHWLKMMSVPESRAVVGRHDGINGRDRPAVARPAQKGPITAPTISGASRSGTRAGPWSRWRTGREFGPFDSEADVVLCLAFAKLDRDYVEIVKDASPMASYTSWL